MSKGHTKVHTHMSTEESKVATILSRIVPSVTVQLVRECFRLGKYHKDRCRPILVKLSHVVEVNSILAGRSKLAGMPGISLKPDVSPAERAIPLKERRVLIDAGTGYSTQGKRTLPL